MLVSLGQSFFSAGTVSLHLIKPDSAQRLNGHQLTQSVHSVRLVSNNVPQQEGMCLTSRTSAAPQSDAEEPPR